MHNFLYKIDLAIFDFLNQTISNPLFDKFFPFITDVKNWYVAFVMLWLIAILKGGRLGKISAIAVIALLIISDQISSHLLKPFFARVRPCNVVENVHLLINCTKSFSMPSSHAVNNFAVAVFFSKLFPKIKIPLFVVASLVALSRPIVGVHYFSDIFIGAIIGSIIGYAISLIVIKIDNFFENRLINK